MFEQEEEESQHSGTPVTNKQLRTAFLFLYNEVMSAVYNPMLKQEKLVKEAAEFNRMLQAEFHWTNGELARRM
jgi:hypothetical protein